GAIEQYGQAGPGFGQARLGALWNIHHSQSTFAALLIRLQNHPMAVPKVAVIARIAIAVFIIKRGIVKVRVGRYRQSQYARTLFKTYLVGIYAGWPHVREHLATCSLPLCRGL